jgi:hypothetical protein
MKPSRHDKAKNIATKYNMNYGLPSGVVGQIALLFFDVGTLGRRVLRRAVSHKPGDRRSCAKISERIFWKLVGAIGSGAIPRDAFLACATFVLRIPDFDTNGGVKPIARHRRRACANVGWVFAGLLNYTGSKEISDRKNCIGCDISNRLDLFGCIDLASYDYVMSHMLAETAQQGLVPTLKAARFSAQGGLAGLSRGTSLALHLTCACGQKRVLCEAMILYRPVGLKELELIAAASFKAFPPRLDWQPIFYPVLNFDYAEQIAKTWNTKDAASGYCGFVTSWGIDDVFLSRYETKTVGGRGHQELWVPAEELEEFNRQILGVIRIEAAHYGEKFAGEIDEKTNLPINLSARDE